MEGTKSCQRCKHYLFPDNFKIKGNGQLTRTCIPCLDKKKVPKERTCRPGNQPLHELMVICRGHIEAQFSEDMTWEDYEYLHIHHKVPFKYEETGRSPTLADVVKALHKASTWIVNGGQMLFEVQTRFNSRQVQD